MLPDLLGLAVAALVLAAPFVSRRLRRRPVAGAAAVSPARPSPAGGTAVPAVTVQPSGVMTGPFAYDNGLAVEPPGESAT